MILIVVAGLLALLVVEVLMYPLWIHRWHVLRPSSREELERIEDEMEQEILALRKHADRDTP